MRIAIVGFGVVGKSVMSFLTSEEGSIYFGLLVGGRASVVIDLLVWDNRQFTTDEEQYITDIGARTVCSDMMTLGEVVTMSDLVIVSPGVNMNRYKQYSHKILCELDIFDCFFKRPTIGITGSLGKTTTTKLLGFIADKILVPGDNKRLPHVVVGGNIGLGMLDLVKQQKKIYAAVLELSSFQLEFNKEWAPDVAIWTNCFANHLDRHETMAAYVDAKMNLLRFQVEDQVALLSASLLKGEVGELVIPALSEIKSEIYLVSSNPEDRALLTLVPRASVGFVTIDNGNVIISQIVDGQVTETNQICAVADLPNVTFTENWLHILAALYSIGIEPEVIGRWIKENKDTLSIANEHRCEFVATVNGVDFYNDSKATVIQSTEAAVRRLADNNRPVILILGGLGKGVDRSPLLAVLQSLRGGAGMSAIALATAEGNGLHIKKIYCFGKECAVFASSATCFATLEEVMADIQKIMAPGDQVLLSPSGTSYDLYKNYEERGNAFKQIVAQFSL